MGIKCGLFMFRRTTCSCRCIKFCRKYNFWVKLGGAFFNNHMHLLSWLKELLLLWPMVEKQVSLPVWSLLSWYCFHLCWPCLSCWTVWVHWHRIVFSFFSCEMWDSLRSVLDQYKVCEQCWLCQWNVLPVLKQLFMGAVVERFRPVCCASSRICGI